MNDTNTISSFAPEPDFACGLRTEGYDLIIDYQQPPETPLSEADGEWAGQV